MWLKFDNLLRTILSFVFLLFCQANALKNMTPSSPIPANLSLTAAAWAHLLILGCQRLVRDLELHLALLIRRELHENVVVVGLALADGGIERDDHKGVGCV